MDAPEFVILVREMRAAQKAFFKSRLPGDVAKAKDFEKRCDKALDEGVTVYATATLETTDGIPAEGEQIGMFLDDDADQRPTGLDTAATDAANSTNEGEQA